jgi:ubiquinol-cytochrome c reductase cytochrome b subunit
VILPLLGIIEKPNTPPSTIEEDFEAHYGKSESTEVLGNIAPTPAE